MKSFTERPFQKKDKIKEKERKGEEGRREINEDRTSYQTVTRFQKKKKKRERVQNEMNGRVESQGKSTEVRAKMVRSRDRRRKKNESKGTNFGRESGKTIIEKEKKPG